MSFFSEIQQPYGATDTGGEVDYDAGAAGGVQPFTIEVEPNEIGYVKYWVSAVFPEGPICVPRIRSWPDQRLIWEYRHPANLFLFRGFSWDLGMRPDIYLSLAPGTYRVRVFGTGSMSILWGAMVYGKILQTYNNEEIFR